jgi:hypothetical protein
MSKYEISAHSILANMAKIEGAIGHRFQSLSIDSFCLRGNMKLASLILDSSSRSRYILSSPGVGSSTLTFKCTVFNIVCSQTASRSPTGGGKGQSVRRLCLIMAEGKLGSIVVETFVPGKQCFLACTHLGSMARKQCFLLCPTFGKYLLRNCSDSWFADLWEIFAGKQRFLAWLTHLWKI